MQQFLSAMQFSISVQQFYDFFQQLCNQTPLNIATKKHVSGSNMWLYTQGLHTALLSGGTNKMRDKNECTVGARVQSSKGGSLTLGKQRGAPPCFIANKEALSCTVGVSHVRWNPHSTQTACHITKTIK